MLGSIAFRFNQHKLLFQLKRSSYCTNLNYPTPAYHTEQGRLPKQFDRSHLNQISNLLKSTPRVSISKPHASFAREGELIRRAAVLVPLLNSLGNNDETTASQPIANPEKLHSLSSLNDNELTGSSAGLLLTLRSPQLRSHSGQVAFPGGIMDPEDGNDPIQTALREAEEEISANRNDIEVLGLFHDVTSTGGLIVTPVIAYIHNYTEYTIANHLDSADNSLADTSSKLLIPNKREVDEIFEVELQTIVDPAHFQVDNLKRGAIPRFIPDHQRRDKDIWGMTAYIIDWFMKSVLTKL